MFGGQVETRSEGAWLTTSNGDRYLNAGGYGVFITGARHPTVIAEVQRQLDTHPVASRLFYEPSLARAASALMSITPPGLERVHFSGSGAEAVETALKLARAAGRRRVISMQNGYHGKTLGALSVTAKSVFQDPFRPLLPDITHVPYGDLSALESELTQYPGESSVIVEPVQGEAGVILPPTGYLHGIATLCTQYNALLILDEIQTGLGRLGYWWGADREMITPDILLAGKGLGGGVAPVAATIASAEVFGLFERDPFLHTSTFSGSPLAMAAAYGAIKAISEEDLVARSAKLGKQLIPAITDIFKRYLGDWNHEVRGRGLLIGIEIDEPGMAGELLLSLVEQNVIANHSLNSEKVLRLTPPAILSDIEVQFLVDAVDRAAKSTIERYI